MPVTGYPNVTSVVPGETINFFLSTDAPGPTNLSVLRLSSLAAPPSAVFTANLTTQPLPVRAWEGFQWTSAADTSFVVPLTWPSGLYVLTAGGDNVLSFVVRQPTPGSTSKVLLHIDFLTHTAYNPSGGKSLYGFNSGGRTEADRATTVSLLRDWAPEYGAPGTVKGRRLIEWLESEGIPVEYCSSVDLHANAQLLTHYECFVVGGCGHDEYWTRAMRENVERFVNNGGNLIVLSGNTCYRAVRLEAGNTHLVFYKYPAADPNANNEDATVAWADPPLNRPPNTLFGAGWTNGALRGANTAYMPYMLRFPSHWAFAGVSATQTSAFMSYETDAAAFVEEPEGYPRVTGEDGSPLAYTVLASADLRAWVGKPGFATMGVYSRNGTVFHAGTTEWVLALGANGDPVINRVTRNVFQRLRLREPWDWEDIGHANFGAALTSLAGRLFIATSQNLLWMRYPVGAEIVWRRIGHTNNVMAMAALSDTVYCVTSDNRLWWREPVESDVIWHAIGEAPPNARSLAACAGMLYATDDSGQLWFTPARRAVPNWQVVPSFCPDPTVKTMTSYANILFAATDDNRLLRTPSDFTTDDPARGWVSVWHCDFAVGLAVVEWMLFVATSKNRLWRLDLAGLRQP